jgi:hypothetical protein
MPNLPLVESSCEDLGHGAGASLLIAVSLFYICACASLHGGLVSDANMHTLLVEDNHF